MKISEKNNNTINILYLMDVLTRVGGTEKQLSYLTRSLNREKFKPVVVVLQNKPLSGIEEFEGFGCVIKYLDIERMFSVRTIFAFIHLVKLIYTEKIDIVQTFFIDANIIGLLASLVGRTKAIVSRRDLGYWYNKKLLLLLRILNKYADSYIVNSHAIKKVVCEKENINPNNVHVIYNGIYPLPADNKQVKINKNQLNIPDTAVIIGIVANLRKVKRLDIFLDVAAEINKSISNSYFIIIGEGELLNELKDKARKLGLIEHVRFIHTISDVLNYMNIFDIGLLTSESEGLSNVLIEYQLCGIPAVAFDVGGNNEIIENGYNGLLAKPYDRHEMACLIISLINDKNLSNRIRDNGRGTATSKFSIEQMVYNTETRYIDILSK